MAGEYDVPVHVGECLAECQVVLVNENLAATSGYATKERNCSS